MNKKAYMCPGTQVADIEVKTSMLESSPGNLTIDSTDGMAIDAEADVFSREERGAWDTEW